MPKRRPNHEGSFYRRKSDGRWMAVFVGAVRSSKNEATARRMWAEMKTAALSGLDLRAGKTAPQTIEVLTARLISPSQARSTQTQYRAALEYLLPYLGAKSVQQLKPFEVLHWLELLARKHGTSKARIRQVAFDLLNRACKLAIEAGLILKSPCLSKWRPTARRKPINPPSAEEAAKILQHSQNHRYHAAFALGLLAGMRPCEIFGLRWSRIDWQRGVIRVDQAAVECGSVELQDHTKTQAGHREIPMIPQLKAALRLRQQQAEAEGLADCELVLPSTVGTPTGRSTFLARVWKPLLTDLGIEARTFYNSRHSCATLLAGSGVPLQVVASILGHKDTRTTLTTYCHVLGGAALQAMDSLSAVYAAQTPADQTHQTPSTKHLLHPEDQNDDSTR